jgi:tetrapyrrole methylase family protein/MazG family protein
MDHPVIKELEKENVTWISFDDSYKKHHNFDDVYIEMCETLTKEAEDKEIVYAVPGHPLVAEKSVKLLLERKNESLSVEILGGQSFLDAMFNALSIDPIEGFQLVDASDLHPDMLHLRHHVIICQVYDRFTASNVKLALMEKLPDDYEVAFVTAAGSEAEDIRYIPLYELDRIAETSNLTSVYVPPVCEDRLLYHEFSTFRQVIKELRGPNGCPWDKKQTHQSLKPYMIEECYELLEALDEEDDSHIVEELGDVMLQVLLHAQIGEDEGWFSIDDVIEGITEKMIRRHPHVFDDKKADNESAVMENWEKIKKQEKPNQKKLLLDDVPKTMPALSRAYHLQKKAAKVGFDWEDVGDIWNKVDEEIKEFAREAETLSDIRKMKAEFGDVLFAFINVGRFYKIEPEEALTMTNHKFYKRFSYIENQVSQSENKLESLTLEELDLLWNEAKQKEREN